MNNPLKSRAENHRLKKGETKTILSSWRFTSSLTGIFYTDVCHGNDDDDDGDDNGLGWWW